MATTGKVVVRIDTESIVEALDAIAAVQHDIWAHWMRYLFSVCAANEDGTVTIPAEKVERWKRQMEIPYAELTPAEQRSDQEQAEKVIRIVPLAAEMNGKTSR